MKKLIIVLGILFVSLFGILIVMPMIFKEDAKKAVDAAIASQLNAHFFYDQEGFSLSLFENFPNFTFSMRDFGVLGVDTFASDTLIQVSSFEITLDLLSVISGEQIIIDEIIFRAPNINILSLHHGQSNYDILKEKVEKTHLESSPQEKTVFSLAIKKWEIIDYFFTMYGEDVVRFTETVKEECNMVGIPISNDFDDYAKNVHQQLKKVGISSEVDLKNHNLNYKIRDHSLTKVPLLLICGKKEVDTNTVTIRRLDSNKQENMELKEFLKQYSALNKAPSI